MWNRRTFLQTTAVTALSASACRSSWGLAMDHPYMKTLGVQMWTVRNQMAKDPLDTMKAIAAAGYHQIETSIENLGRDIPLAKDNGLAITSAFIDWRTLADPDDKDAMTVDATIEAAKKHGLKHLVFGYIGKHRRETIDHYKSAAELSNKAAEQCQAADLKLCYHNHSFEFEALTEGTCGFDIFMQEFDPKLMQFELDVFWTALGGWDPIDTMKKLGNRISQLHLKDLKAETSTIYDEGQVPKDAFKELGNGTIAMKPIIELAQELGVEQCHVEQDESPDPVKSIGTSIEHLKMI